MTELYATGAPLATYMVYRLHVNIAKINIGVRTLLLTRLELYAGKLARTVLRGRRRGNTLSVTRHLCKFFERGASWKRLTKYWRNWKRWAISGSVPLGRCVVLMKFFIQANGWCQVLWQFPMRDSLWWLMRNAEACCTCSRSI